MTDALTRFNWRNETVNSVLITQQEDEWHVRLHYAGPAGGHRTIRLPRRSAADVADVLEVAKGVDREMFAYEPGMTVDVGELQDKLQRLPRGSMASVRLVREGGMQVLAVGTAAGVITVREA